MIHLGTNTEFWEDWKQTGCESCSDENGCSYWIPGYYRTSQKTCITCSDHEYTVGDCALWTEEHNFYASRCFRHIKLKNCEYKP